jgi:hypothetical protein
MRPLTFYEIFSFLRNRFMKQAPEISSRRFAIAVDAHQRHDPARVVGSLPSARAMFYQREHFRTEFRYRSTACGVTFCCSAGCGKMHRGRGSRHAPRLRVLGQNKRGVGDVGTPRHFYKNLGHSRLKPVFSAAFRR